MKNHGEAALMGSRAKAYHGERLYALLCSGNVDAERARTAARMACRQASEMGYALLFDLRGSRIRVPLDFTEGILGESENLWRWVHRVALVGDDPENLDWLRFVSGIAQNSGVIARVFEDQAEARAWAVAAAVDPLKGLDREAFSVLVVDDDPDILQISSRALEGAGFRVLSAGSGEEGLQVALREVPDLILLDVVMPDLEGPELCRRMKAEPTLAGSYVALASGLRTGLEDQVVGLDSGADGYIPRPLGNQELVARIEILLRRRRIDQEAHP